MALSHSLILCYVFCTVDLQPAQFIADSSNMIVKGTQPALQLTATPDYPVAVGQEVSLRCCAQSSHTFDNWSWQRQEQERWQEVAKGYTLTLSKPQESGLYRCFAQRNLTESVSPSHAVLIISIHAIANVGITALVLSLLALVMNIAVMFWLGWQRLRGEESPANMETKGFPKAGKKDEKRGPAQAENEGHVYMNYSSTNLTYTELDPTGVTANNAYSVLP
ncbi:uncharacterized protein LOC127614230 [Hippocampus zosterae]|uniref:uncharacterized protein LOC127614230 n=1 Tax=Hippocampus zosterae TaxID=109293 RepID=UPI00223D2B13|nr:uncharacterized protein LOC127614230 [Hippocampus zosterae]